MDEQGLHFHVGRSDQIVKVGGLKVAPAEIEERLDRHDSVRECLVVPAEDANGVVSLTAFVVLRAGWPADASHERCLRRFVGAALAAHKRPRRIVFVPALPRTARGKVDRRALGERAVALAAGEP
jgi:acyl-coenzyme A synthetase/AMP-(fatty) acid ligase